MTTTVGCLQPTYLPWIPFFERFLKCDYFVLLDDVDYSKHKYQNRTYVKMNRIDKKILEDIDILSKAMEKNNLCEVKFSDENISYELKIYLETYMQL